MELECSSLPLNEKHHLTFQLHNTNIDDRAEGRAYTFASSSCTTMPLLRTATTPPPSCTRWTMTTSSNRTTSTLNDCTSMQPACCLDSQPTRQDFTQQLHNKPTTDELMANLALADMDLIHIAPLILQGLYNTLLTSVRTLSGLLRNNHRHHAAHHRTWSRRRP